MYLLGKMERLNQNLIIATAAGYKFDQIELFLKTLNYFFDGELLLLTDQKFRLPLYNFKTRIGDISSDYFRHSVPFSLNSPNNRRLYFAKKFINDNTQYRKIFLTDIRDVIFQEDPFNALINEKLQVAVEDVLIGDNEYNSSWIRALMGEDYFQIVKNKNVLCSGTILGERDVILKYLDFTTNLINEKGVHLDTGENFFIIDQGAFIVFCNEHPDLVHRHTNENGKIFTMSYIGEMILSADGTLLNNDQELYSIVHQYDRYPFLVDLFKRRNNIFGMQQLKDAVKTFLRNYFIPLV